MSTLSLRKIKHDSSAVDNIQLNSNGNTSVGTTNVANVPLEVGGSVALGRISNTAYSRFIGIGGSGGTFINGTTGGGYVEFTNDASYNNEIHLVTHWSGNQHSRVVSVDYKGRVTMPYQPMFTVVQPTVATSVGANPNYYFSGYTIINNVGNHFNNSTGSFTAPVTGNYLFRFLIMGADNGTSSSPHCGFSINGNTNTGGGSYASNGMWEHPTNANHKTDTMHIIRMTANDTIRAMSLHQGISQPDRTYFMGVLLG